MIWLLICIILMVVFCYKQVSILIAAPVLSICLAILSGMDFAVMLTEGFLPTFGTFCQNFFLIFAAGSIFARFMQDTGMASSIAKVIGKKFGSKYAILCIFITSVILTYGGVSLFVIVFVLYPISLQLFKEANITRHLIPAAIAAGAFTFSTTCLPGSMQAVSLLASTTLGTSLTVMPVLGIVCAAFMCVLTLIYLNYALKKSREDGLEFENDEEVSAQIEKFDSMTLPNFWLSLLPLVVVFVTLNLLKFEVYVSMMLGVATAFAFGWKNIDNKLGTLNAGVTGAVFALINTAAANGFGGVAKLTPAFAQLCEMLTTGSSIPPILNFGIATTLIAGACGSGLGGLSIALTTLGPIYIDMGFNPGLLHRISLIAAGGLDSLPHNGAIITMLTSCKVSHKDGYKHLGWITVVIPLITMFFCMLVSNFIQF